MLSACARVTHGLENVLAAERAADRETAALVARQEARARDQHAALRTMGERLERQAGGVLRQQAAVERLSAALSGPHGLQDRLAGLQKALQEITADLALLADGRGGTGAAGPSRAAHATRDAGPADRA